MFEISIVEHGDDTLKLKFKKSNPLKKKTKIKINSKTSESFHLNISIFFCKVCQGPLKID